MGLDNSDMEAIGNGSDACATTGSPGLWPQSFRQAMKAYSRSTSQRREDDLGLEGVSSGFGSASSPRIGNESAREPLLTKVGQHNLRTDSESEQGSTFSQAVFNGMNVLAGVGILSTPYAAAQGGWLGLILLLVFALVCCYTAILLRRCLDSDPRIRSYQDVGEASFGKWGRWTVSIMLCLELYAVAIEFLIMEGDNLAQLFPSAGIAIGSRLVLGPHQVFVILSALCMLPTVWLRELRLLSYISAFGVVASFLIVSTVAWIGLLDPNVGFHIRGSLLHLEGLPVAVGLYTFCFCGHAVFPSIYTSMRDRTQFSHVLVLCFALCTLMYGGIAAMGYSMFGDELQSQITLNLPREAPASHFAIWVTLVNPFAKYAITLTPVAVALEELILVDSGGKDVVRWGAVVRTGLVASTVVVALAVPLFGLLMSFIGSFLSASVSIVLPCLCYLKIYGDRVPVREASCVWSLLVLGVVVGTVGTFSSLKAIIDNFLELGNVGLLYP